MRCLALRGSGVVVVAAVACVMLVATAVRAGDEVTLAQGGEARMSVIVAAGADERVRDAAADLARQLSRITGGTFSVEEGDGGRGIAVGVHGDFPGVVEGEIFDPEDIAGREQYVIRTHRHGIWLLGATPLAAQHAVWDLLHRVGHRQFFPTETWEVVPHEPDLTLALAVNERPDHYNRMGPRGAPWTDVDMWRRWHARNRMTSAFSLSTGHAYDGIIRRNRDTLDANPEYLALVNGERGGGRGDKFCISNDELRELVVRDAIGRTGPDTDSISMDPSDGASWCECAPCAEMGSVSDRVVILANEVAEAINDLGHGDKYVGIYAYNQHSPPPSVDVHPKVIVSIATSFIRGGYTLEELIEGWSARTELIGIREYHDVHTWSRAKPRRARGGRVGYLVDRLPYFHEQGARFMNSEASDSWGANGLGYYLSARLLWDVSEAQRVEELIDDFVDKAFGDAREPMRAFYHLIAEDHDTVRTNEDVLARMYRHIDAARGLTDEADVLRRLDELALYTRYVELHYAYDDASGAARQRAGQELFRHAYRMRDTMLVHPQALYRSLRRDGIDVPSEANPGRLSVGAPGEDYEPWKSSEPFSDDEIARFIAEGIESHEKLVMPFEPVAFSDELVPAAEALALREVSTGDVGRGNTFRGRYTAYTWLEPNQQLSFEVTGGLIAHYRDRGNVQFRLFSPQEVTLDPVDVDESVPPDGETYSITLESPHEGLHELEWSDGSDMTRLAWREGQHLTFRSSIDSPARLRANRTVYFYVPRDTETVGGFTTATRGRMLDGDGNVVLDFADMEAEGYFAVDVPEGQDGQLWTLQRAYGQQMLMTVPPYLARNERELLLPREVVEADAR